MKVTDQIQTIQAHTTYVFAFWKRNWKYQMPVRTKDLDKAIAEVIGTFEGVEEIIALLREGIVRKDILAVLPTG